MKRISYFYISLILAIVANSTFASEYRKSIPVVTLNDCSLKVYLPFLLKHPRSTCDINVSDNDTTICWENSGIPATHNSVINKIGSNEKKYLLEKEDIAIVNMIGYPPEVALLDRVLVIACFGDSNEVSYIDIFKSDIQLPLDKILINTFGSADNFLSAYTSFLSCAFDNIAQQMAIDTTKDAKIKDKLKKKRRHSLRYYERIDSVFVKGNTRITYYHDGSSVAQNFHTEGVQPAERKDTTRHFIKSIQVIQFHPETFMEDVNNPNLNCPEVLEIYRCGIDSLYKLNYEGKVYEHDDIIMKINKQSDKFLASKNDITLLRLIEDDFSSVLHTYKYFILRKDKEINYGKLAESNKVYDFYSLIKKSYGSFHRLKNWYIAVELNRFRELLGVKIEADRKIIIT